MLPKLKPEPALNSSLEGLRNSRKPKPVTLATVARRFGVGVFGVVCAWVIFLGVCVGVLAAARVALAIVGWP